MPYSTKADILTEISEEDLIGLTDDEGAGIINDARVTAAIAKADGIIDSYCGQVTDVPFTTIPPVIKQHSLTIALYFLYSRRSAIPDTRKDNYKEAMRHLGDIATGKAALPVAGAQADSNTIETARTEDDRLITMGKPSDDSSSGTLDNY